MQVFITGATGYIDARKAVRLPRVAAPPRGFRDEAAVYFRTRQAWQG
jgi:hypothetical protein